MTQTLLRPIQLDHPRVEDLSLVMTSLPSDCQCLSNFFVMRIYLAAEHRDSVVLIAEGFPSRSRP